MPFIHNLSTYHTMRVVSSSTNSKHFSIAVNFQSPAIGSTTVSSYIPTFSRHSSCFYKQFTNFSFVFKTEGNSEASTAFKPNAGTLITTN